MQGVGQGVGRGVGRPHLPSPGTERAVKCTAPLPFPLVAVATGGGGAPLDVCPEEDSHGARVGDASRKSKKSCANLGANARPPVLAGRSAWSGGRNAFCPRDEFTIKRNGRMQARVSDRAHGAARSGAGHRRAGHRVWRHGDTRPSLQAASRSRSALRQSRDSRCTDSARSRALWTLKSVPTMHCKGLATDGDDREKTRLETHWLYFVPKTNRLKSGFRSRNPSGGKTRCV